MQDTARDSTSGGDAPKITSPSISDVLAAYLAEDIARFAAKTYGLHADVNEMLQHYLSVIAHPRWSYAVLKMEFPSSVARMA